MKKLVFALYVFSIVLFSQHPTKFTIGAEHISSFSDAWYYPSLQGSHSDAYWDTVKSFGVNYGSLYYNQAPGGVSIDDIKADLVQADSHNIKILLNNLFNEGKYPRKWLYNVESDYDFDTILGNSDYEDGCERHWTEAHSPNAPNYLALRVGEILPDTVIKNLREPSDSSLQSDNCVYYVRAKMRLHNIPGTSTPVITVRVINKNTGVYLDRVVMSALFNSLDWQEELLFAYYKCGNGPLDPIPKNYSETGIIVNDSIGTPGLPDYKASATIFTDYDLQVYWHNNIDCDIDYLTIEDSVSYSIVNKNNGLLNQKMHDFVSEYSNHPAIANYKLWDEPLRCNFYALRYLNQYLTAELDSFNLNQTRKTHSFYANPNRNYGSAKQYLFETEMPQLFLFNYPFIFNTEKPNSNVYTDTAQVKLNGAISQMDECIKEAQKFTVPFLFVVQTHKWDNCNDHFVREASAYESKVLANLAVCYGARGIHYYLLTDPYMSNDSLEGLFNNNNAAGPTPRYYDEYGYPKWNTLKQLNQYLGSIGDELMSLTWKKSYSIHLNQPPSNEFITQVSSYYTNSAELLIPDASSQIYVELGEFKKTNELNNDMLEYFYVVNRRTLPEENRTIKVRINKASYSYKNWIVKEMGTTNSWVVSDTGTFQTTYSPGEGKLFRLEPVMIAGGTLGFNEIIPDGARLNEWRKDNHTN